MLTAISNMTTPSGEPPYNTGAKDWKYNHDFVDADDAYRHGKWLSFMERRLKLAKRLLKTDNSVMAVTIDEKEYLRLGLLLEQTVPEARIQMVSSAINSKGATRSTAFGRTDEYVFFLMFGQAKPRALPLGNEWKVVRDSRAEKLRWAELRSEESRERLSRGCFRSWTDGSILVDSSGYTPVFLPERNGESPPTKRVVVEEAASCVP